MREAACSYQPACARDRRMMPTVDRPVKASGLCSPHSVDRTGEDHYRKEADESSMARESTV